MAGLGLGVWMGATENFALAPVHAHTNLLGWVSMLLYGLFYRVVPQATQGSLPMAHFVMSLVGLVIMLPSLAFYLMGNKAAAVPLAVASVAVFAGMVIFAVIVFRATSRK